MNADDQIYEQVDALMKSGDWLELDRRIGAVIDSPESVDELVTWLTATLPGYRRLPSRPALFELAWRTIRNEGGKPYEPLKGLLGKGLVDDE